MSFREKITPGTADRVYAPGFKDARDVGDQFVFDPLDWADQFGMLIEDAEKAALSWRNNWKREFQKRGVLTVGTSLRGQLKPYKSLGEPDGRTRTIYYLQVAGFE